MAGVQIDIAIDKRRKGRTMHPSTIRRTVAVALAATALFALTVAVAAAQSTHWYPTNQAIAVSSAPVSIVTPLGTTTCTQSSTKFMTNTGSASGPTKVQLVPPPTYTACSKIKEVEPVVTTSGTWWLAIQYGAATATVEIPAEGLKMTVGSLGHGVNVHAGNLVGGWNNGFTSPSSVPSAFQFGGQLAMNWFISKETETSVTFNPTLLTTTDTTNPLAVALVGP